MTLEVLVRHKQGDFSLDASFQTAGRLLALFGPSGSGKTTIVNMVAGLVRPDSGRIVLNGTVLFDSACRIHVPSHKRRIGYVFQDGRLFPHMSVSGNLRYGMRAPGEKPFDEVVDLLGIGHLLRRRPFDLSGGEKQRVAIGRALLTDPALILMDEPLSALDGARRAELLPYIERLRDNGSAPVIYVSHSVSEVSQLATDVVLLDNGTVTSAGPTASVLGRLDLLPNEQRGEGGTVLDMVVTSGDDRFETTTLTGAIGEIVVAGTAAANGSTVRVRIRARDVMIAKEEPKSISALNVLPGIVREVTPVLGGLADVVLKCGEGSILARITTRSVERLRLHPGQKAWAVLKTVSLDPPATAPVRNA